MADTITIIDDRTGKKVTVPITGGVFPSSALRELEIHKVRAAFLAAMEAARDRSRQLAAGD